MYVYFYELGFRVLRPSGRLSFVVTNKWMKAGYGEPLRRFFSESTWMESVIDFGHAKQIFEDADVFPCIIVVRKPTDEPKPPAVRVCEIPRDQLRVDDLSSQVAEKGFEVAASQLGTDSWELDSDGVSKLVGKIRKLSQPLSAFEKSLPLSGIKTGFNDAYLITAETRAAIVGADPSCSEIIRPFLRGQDFSRWGASWAGLWMIVLKSSENWDWPWASAGKDAEGVFATAFPSIHAHLSTFRQTLEARQDQGRFWWELRSCAYWGAFDKPKIMYPEITWRAEWCFDTRGTLLNNAAYIIPTDDIWVLAVANSPVSWWYSWRNAVHGKDEPLRFIKDYVKTLPIPSPSAEQRAAATFAVQRLLDVSDRSPPSGLPRWFTGFCATENRYLFRGSAKTGEPLGQAQWGSVGNVLLAISSSQHEVRRTLLDWLKVEYEIDKPSMKLQDPIGLDSDGLVAEVKKLRGKKKPLTAAGLKALRDEDAQTLAPARELAAEALTLEGQISDLVNAAYGLTPDEVRLMWDTAPPRMPIPRPKA